MSAAEQIILHGTLPIAAQNGGLFVSRGVGRHPDRVITSHELIVVRSGILSIQEETTPFCVGVGEALLLLPHRRHFGTYPYSADLSFYWFHFDIIAQKGESSVPVPQFTRLSGDDAVSEVMVLCRRFLDIQSRASLGSDLKRNLILWQLLAEIGGSVAGSDAIAGQSMGQQLALRADALLRVGFANPGLGTQSLADQLGVNPDYLGRVFRRTFGRSVTDSLHEYRLRYARSLLMDDTKNVAEIARAAGFSDAGYFRRIFKRHAAVSPQEFRRLHTRAHINTDS